MIFDPASGLSIEKLRSGDILQLIIVNLKGESGISNQND
jgi:hypothetical protein